MTLHLQKIAATVAPGAHAIVIVDQAGWHFSNALENVSQFMRDNWLSNRIFNSYTNIPYHCCFAWNQLIDQPWRIMSSGLRGWAHQ